MNFTVTVNTYGDAEALKYAEEALRKYCGCEAFDWTEKNHIEIKTSCDSIKKAFEDIINAHERVFLWADCSETVREDDRSAEWWCSTQISVEKKDGKYKILEYTSTDWR